MNLTVEQLTRVAKRRLAEAERHAAISKEHMQISKTLGGLADSYSNSDPTLSKCASTLADCHQKLSKHYAAMATIGPDIAKPGDQDDETTSKRFGFDQQAAFERPYNSPGGAITERTRAALELMGGDASIDPLSKSAWSDDLDAIPRAGSGDPLQKRAWES